MALSDIELGFPVFESIQLWIDSEYRTGPMNMAIDQLLLETIDEQPILRVYNWSVPTVSFGYFLPLADVKLKYADEELQYVRRITGGGIVDHRQDSTYTLIIPKSHPLSQARGDTSYQIIHQALSNALVSRQQSVKLALSECSTPTPERVRSCQDCFVNPVRYDLMNDSGVKIAGAGQKRSRTGLLHQGSLAGSVQLTNEHLAESLADELSERRRLVDFDSDFLNQAEQVSRERYASRQWLEKK